MPACLRGIKWNDMGWLGGGQTSAACSEQQQYCPEPNVTWEIWQLTVKRGLRSNEIQAVFVSCCKKINFFFLRRKLIFYLKCLILTYFRKKFWRYWKPKTKHSKPVLNDQSMIDWDTQKLKYGQQHKKHKTIQKSNP